MVSKKQREKGGAREQNIFFKGKLPMTHFFQLVPTS
jgi:hypothetical protein